MPSAISHAPPLELISAFAAPPFLPPRWLRNCHVQTLIASRKPRRWSFGWEEWESVNIPLGNEGAILGEASWQPGPRADSPTLVLLHGLEGSARSHYLVGMSKKAFAAGFHTVRVNTRNCGGTEHLTPTLYCAGLSQDVGHLTKHLREKCGVEDIYLAGVSLGANIILKHLGEQGERAGIQGAAVVSPPIDLGLCAQRMLEPRNWIYQRYFVQRLKERMQRKALHFPGITDLSRVARVRTIYEFDEVVTAPHFGFGTADNYYRLASSAPLLRNIRTPTLLIQALDDPMIPFEPFRNSGIEENEFLHLLVTQYGGHVGFLGSRPACAADQDVYWAESRVVEFLTMLAKN